MQPLICISIRLNKNASEKTRRISTQNKIKSTKSELIKWLLFINWKHVSRINQMKRWNRYDIGIFPMLIYWYGTWDDFATVQMRSKIRPYKKLLKIAQPKQITVQCQPDCSRSSKSKPTSKYNTLTIYQSKLYEN